MRTQYCMMVLALTAGLVLGQDRPIRVPSDPALSPSGKTMAFAWQGDIWLAETAGGPAHRITWHGANDSSPHFSPDGKTIAFLSTRDGGSQIWTVPATGGAPTKITTESGRKRLWGYTSDGEHFVVTMTGDRGFHSSENARLYFVPAAGGKKRMAFDAGFADAAVSPDGTKVLFTRGRASFSRKGYQGSQATQMWLADLSQTPVSMTRLDEDRPNFQNVSWLAPMWAADGGSFYYVSDPDGTFDLYAHDLDHGESRRLTRVGAVDRSDDGVADPTISADGTTIVFRRRFDLQRLDVATGALNPIALHATGDVLADARERISDSSTSTVAFTDDGKQMAFVAGSDIWVMDRILREPRRVTQTPHEESSLLFSADGKQLYFVSDASGEVDIWRATCDHEKGWWWQSESFELSKVTEDAAVEDSLALSPTGKHIAYVKGTELFCMDSDGSDHRRVVATWSTPNFDWSPDGKWLVYATQDSDYNSDVWVTPLDGTREPFNLSRHPDRDSSPTWSPDGTRIAFVSRRDGEESDIYWVNLQKDVEEKTARDRKLEEAIAAMEKKGGRGSRGAASAAGAKAEDRPASGRRGRGRGRANGGTDPKPEPLAAKDQDEEKPAEKKNDEAPKDVVIDFDGIFERLHRIRNPEAFEGGLLWAPDGKKLAFQTSVNGESGLYTVEFPDPGRPQKLASSGLSSARWLSETKEIVGVSRGARDGDSRRRGGFGGGTPAAMNDRGAITNFSFQTRAKRDWRAIRTLAFDQAWRAMRDRFYDPAMNNRDWLAIRAKYGDVAGQCLGEDEFSTVVNMMLGELNASHMGHRGGSDPLPDAPSGDAWAPTTYHLGLRFKDGGEETGLEVESIIPGSPCSLARSRVEPEEVLLSIDGTPVGPDVDLTALLTLDEARDLELEVANREGQVRKVTVRPVASVSDLLYDEWTRDNRRQVDELSGGKLGYLHIRGMDMGSFRQMETDLYHAGHGKDGLIIDVRFNGGGSTTDHVLTALTQPVHAITVSRGSDEGYPQDRKVYASWSKPIVLMCNEHSFSNAEILSHAIKQLGRGRVVGMRTAGGVISTGSSRLIDGSTVRMPTRGWYLVNDGTDMELNGCMPDIALWNPPGGPDLQLATAVSALAEDVQAWHDTPRPKLVPASARRRPGARPESGLSPAGLVEKPGKR
ncbi:MAG: PD40 domain-containing protein [Planctomycetes bacterium]|nr:PD40 domain-containing protein [Planctomycetota bacterium]